MTEEEAYDSDLCEFGICMRMLGNHLGAAGLDLVRLFSKGQAHAVSPQMAVSIFEDWGEPMRHYACNLAEVPTLYLDAVRRGAVVLLWMRDPSGERINRWWDLDACSDHLPRLVRCEGQVLSVWGLELAEPYWTGHLLISQKVAEWERREGQGTHPEN